MATEQVPMVGKDQYGSVTPALLGSPQWGKINLERSGCGGYEQKMGGCIGGGGGLKGCIGTARRSRPAEAPGSVPAGRSARRCFGRPN